MKHRSFAAQPGRWRRLTRIAVMASMPSLVWSEPARSDEMDRCASASEGAQQLRLDGKLREARETLLMCTRKTCPRIVRADCEQWLSEVEAALPTVIFGAVDEGGHDLVDVSVVVDGVRVLDSINGKPIPIDPGPHVMHYERADGTDLEDRVVIRQSEKNRVLTARFSLASPATPRAPAANAPRAGNPATKARPEASAHVEPPEERASREWPVVTYTIGGIGAASLLAFAYFAIKGQSDYKSCLHAATCSQSEADRVKVERALAWTTLGVGAVGVGVAGALFFRPTSSSPSPGVHLALDALRGGGVAGVGGSF
jgi:hypothetical protein